MHRVPALLAILLTISAAIGASMSQTLLALLAAAAALVAAHERRHRDMALATGIAAALAPAGWILLPVLAGTAIARRIVTPALVLAVAAGATTVIVVGPTPPAALSIDWRIAGVDLRGLAAAAGVGLATWTAATASSRPMLVRETDALALPCAALLPLLLPLGIESLCLVPVLLLSGARLRDLPAAAANRNPLPLRV